MPSASLRERKAALRAELLARRRAIPPDRHATLSEAICRRAAELPPYGDAYTVHTYLGTVAGEVATLSLLEHAWAAGKRVLCPRIGPEGRLESHEVRSTADFVDGPMGLREPDPTRAALVDPGAIDLAIVPGVGFDRRGRRIGFGAGYYDRFLATTDAIRMGLAFSLQMIGRIPQGPGDETVDWIVTQTEVIDCSRREPLRPES
ncbi:MAG: 5-formyltetrahydrofolate cyclo-ligase [Gemmatimonadota bacterium]